MAPAAMVSTRQECASFAISAALHAPNNPLLRKAVAVSAAAERGATAVCGSMVMVSSMMRHARAPDRCDPPAACGLLGDRHGDIDADCGSWGSRRRLSCPISLHPGWFFALPRLSAGAWTTAFERTWNFDRQRGNHSNGAETPARRRGNSASAH